MHKLAELSHVYAFQPVLELLSLKHVTIQLIISDIMQWLVVYPIL